MSAKVLYSEVFKNKVLTPEERADFFAKVERMSTEYNLKPLRVVYDGYEWISYGQEYIRGSGLFVNFYRKAGDGNKLLSLPSSFVVEILKLAETKEEGEKE